MSTFCRRLRRAAVAIVAYGFFAASAVAYAQDADAPRTVIVGLYVSPPFVMKSDHGYDGMAIDLWEDLASDLHIAYEYRELETLKDLVGATADGEVDIAVTNLTVTEDRAKRVDFTQPWYDAGLRIMVKTDRKAGFYDVVRGLRKSGYIRAYAWLVMVIVLATLVLTLFDRRFDKEFPRRWREGVAESFYSVMSIATSGRASHKNLFGWVGRVWAGIWLICGVAVLAYITSTVTSVMTTLALTNQIHNVNDLSGKRVAAFTGSVAEDFCRESGFDTSTFENIEAAADALTAGRVAAIVGDGPVLEYYAHVHPELPVSVVGPIFERDKYAFALARQSPHTRTVTVEVLGAHEEGFLEDLRAKYFGEGR